jgi:hypothetical protein
MTPDMRSHVAAYQNGEAVEKTSALPTTLA